MKGDWYRAHLNDYIVKVYSTDVHEIENGIEIAVKQSFGWSIYQPFAVMDVIYIISGNEICVKCNLETSNKVTFLPRFGLRLLFRRALTGLSISDTGLMKAISISTELHTWAISARL